MADTETLDTEEDPSWVLELLDADDIRPPVETLKQELPFGELTWQNFERLCLRIAGTDGDAECCRLYGTEGQAQGGIDIYVRRRSTPKYATWQSKRHKSFGPSDIQAAVERFLAHEWAANSDRFVLCVQTNLRSTSSVYKIEECAVQLRQKDIEFLTLDGEGLSERLKALPQIVYDFFGIGWVKLFCGAEAAHSVGQRLEPTEFRELKAQLAKCYQSHFASVDPGVLSLTTIGIGAKRSLPLFKRFVAPELLQQTDIVASEPLPIPTQASSSYEALSGLGEMRTPISRIEDQPRREETRIFLQSWLAGAYHEIVLGPAGAGKSTLLRFIALDMLSTESKLVGWQKRLPDFLPIWVSFAFWTKRIAQGRDGCSLVDAIGSWFRLQDEPGIIALVRKAYDDKRLLLLVDGIDEWANETAANTAFSLLQSFAERNSTPVIMTSRPHGVRLVMGLDSSWRVSKIAPFTPHQQIALAKIWFAHLSLPDEEESRITSRSLDQARKFVAELMRTGAMAQLAAIPLLLTGLIALKNAQLALPRNRFLAYDNLTKLIVELHPMARERAALAGAPRHSIEIQTRETALAALAYAIHGGEDGVSADAIETHRAVAIVSQCLLHRLGMTEADAMQAARTILSIGEEDIGILVKKSRHEVGFLHRCFQEFLSCPASAPLRQIGGVEERRISGSS